MHVLPFLSYVFVTAFTPGPNNIMSMSLANQHGLKKTFKFNLGVFAGFAVLMLLCSFFNLILANWLPKIEFVLSVIGALYMVYLAYKIVKSKPRSSEDGSRELSSFLTGMWLQFVNPKVILYGITAISTFVIPFYESKVAMILFSLFLAFVGFLGTLCWAVFGALFQKFLSTYRTPFNLVMGLLLLYSAVSIFVDR